jgi:hypothetical protein
LGAGAVVAVGGGGGVDVGVGGGGDVGEGAPGVPGVSDGWGDVGDGSCVGAPVGVGEPTWMTTVRSVPKDWPFESRNFQFPWYGPSTVGAVMFTEMSVVCSTSRAPTLTAAGAPRLLPLSNASWAPAGQAHVPSLTTLQVLTNACPGSSNVPSGMVISAMYAASRQSGS